MKRAIISAIKRQFRLVVTSMLLVMTLLAVLPTTLPHNLESVFSLAPKRALAASNPIVTENAQPGSTGWQFDTDSSGNPLEAANHEIEGYASATSVNQGGQISFMVSLSSSAQYTMDIYRMGYYPTGTNPDGSACVGPCGARFMQHIGPLNGSKQATCPTTTTTTNFGLTECHWAVAYTLTVPTTWTTGVYIVKLIRLDSGLEQYMTFVVRNDSGPADIVLSEDVTTWQAYNFWGGAGNGDVGYSLYGKYNDVTYNNLSSTRAYAVSFDRPYLVQGETDGAGNFMDWDYPMIRWLEAQGYNVTYATDVDLETNANLLVGRKAFINTGHDEYYSANMRSHVQGFINAGVNVGFFSANNIYWKINWANSSSGQADRIEICYKNTNLDPTTTLWRDLSQPENSIVGVMQNGVASDRAYRVYDSTSWIYAGTGLVNYTSGNPITSGTGQNAIAGIIGYEIDERADNDSRLSSFVSFDPAGLHQVGHSNVPASDGNATQVFSDATLYTASSGAIVFAAGTIQWSWGLDNGFNDGFCSGCSDGSFANSKSQQITTNILNKFISGAATPAPAVSLSPTSLSFGNQQVNTSSAAQTVTLTNSGTAALTINSIGLSGTNAGDFAQTNTCPSGSSTLAAGSNCTISVTFTPTATGTRSASVSITDNASGSPHTVTLSGSGTSAPAPAVSLSPTSLSFGNQNVNTTSAAQTVTLKNSGTAALTINSISLAGTNPGDFAQTNTCPTGSSTLAAGSNCTISVTFTPTTSGSRSASVSITDTASDSPQSVALSGTGVTPAPAVSLTPSSLSFGNQNVNTTSTAQTVTLKNSGTAALSINSIGVTGTNATDFAQTSACPISPSTLAAGASCTISVTFTPTATGTRSASVSITDNAAGSPQVVALTGTGSSTSNVIFSDGFESGSLPGNWTSTSVSSGNSLSLDSTLVHSGTASLKAVVTQKSNGNAYISKTISGQSSLDVRAYYYLSNPVNWGAVQVMSLYAQGYFIGWVTYNVDPSAPTLTVYNGANNTYYNCSVPSLNAWHSLELQYVLSTTTTGSFALWLDGTKACGATAIKTSAISGLTVDQVVVGSDTSDSSVGLTVHVDDVVISKSYVGP